MGAEPFLVNVISYNIHKGFSPWNRSFVLPELREMLRASGADVAFLQEVHGKHEGHERTVSGWPQESQFEFLADQVWSHYAYGRNAVYEEGDHGNAVLSKFPIVRHENIDVSTNRFERRGLLHAVIRPPGNGVDIHLICVHLNLMRISRERQLERLAARIAEHVPSRDPLVVAGDFNDWQRRADRILVRELGLREAHVEISGGHARTFPSRFPFLCLDRIYLRGFHVEEARCLGGAPWERFSDHLPVAARFRLER